MSRVNIIGAGLAGMSCAIALAEQGIKVRIISDMPSNRAQSVMAEGGINGALNVMGQRDTITDHYNDTYAAGCCLANEDAVKNMTENAPAIIRSLERIGVPFNSDEKGIIQRSFGGQKKKRTAFVGSSTGKSLVAALMDECRKYEDSDLIKRYSHHELVSLDIKNATCLGVWVKDLYKDQIMYFPGESVLCAGGMNGLFMGHTTGTLSNSSDVAAVAYAKGVKLSNLEMIQYHPTTFAISGKRCLISEAARGEGGRLFINRQKGTGMERWYFMEEIYPELGNLMPRDIVSRTMVEVLSREDCEDTVYLDMTGISKRKWKERLADLREEIIHYLGIDPAKKPVAVGPGIHYFMGGIDVDENHKTNIDRLYAAGECCSLYHGANRLGGNSLLGAIFGGSKAAKTIVTSVDDSYRVHYEGPVKDMTLNYLYSNENLTREDVVNYIERACIELGIKSASKDTVKMESPGIKSSNDREVQFNQEMIRPKVHFEYSGGSNLASKLEDNAKKSRQAAKEKKRLEKEHFRKQLKGIDDTSMDFKVRTSYETSSFIENHKINQSEGVFSNKISYQAMKADEIIQAIIMDIEDKRTDEPLIVDKIPKEVMECGQVVRAGFADKVSQVMYESLGIIRDKEGLDNGFEKLEELGNEAKSARERNRIELAEALIESAKIRQESRGAHWRMDFPKRDDVHLYTTTASFVNGRPVIEKRGK